MLLSSKNIHLSRPSKKLENRYLGLFEIKDVINTQAYRLALPKSFGKVHPVFYVSLLEPYNRRSEEAELDSPPVVVLPDGEEYEVEAILNTRRRRGTTEYLIKWTGYPDWEISWELEKNLQNAKKLLEEFKSRWGQKAGEKPGTNS